MAEATGRALDASVITEDDVASLGIVAGPDSEADAAVKLAAIVEADRRVALGKEKVETLTAHLAGAQAELAQATAEREGLG